MVCVRCKNLVKSELDKLGLSLRVDWVSGDHGGHVEEH